METKPTKSMGGKVVRVVARIRPSTDLEIQSSEKLVSVLKPKGDESETVSISSGDQVAGGSSKDSCKLDYCYEENETTGLIYTKEIRPLISSVFEGKDANVVAHGARFSGKTSLIQGSEKEPGIAVLTMAEMLSMAQEREDSISISIYEVSQETVYDLLDHEKRVVSVLESAQGKIQLKGLSQVPVKSLSEFQNLYSGLKKIQKLTIDPPLRSHKGVMIHVTTSNANSGSLGRMNFLDLAGYEDSRKRNSDLAPLEVTRINKSIYALQNVMYALNANESHVPYRESKLTRMLKDCLQGCNRTLLITCLPRKHSQDSFYMLNLASRICLGSNRAVANPKKKINTVARPNSLSSAAQRRETPVTVSATSKKQTGPRGNLTERRTKLNTSAPAMKGRKLFTEANVSVKRKNISKKEIPTPKVVLSVQASSSEEEVCSSFVVTDSQASLVEEELSALALTSSAVALEAGYSTSASLSSEVVDTIVNETPQKHEEKCLEATYCDDAGKAQVVEGVDNSSVVEEDLTMVNAEGENMDKENNNVLANETASPPLSMRLQELSNTLKSICKASNQASAPEKYHTALTKSQEEEVPDQSDISVEPAAIVELRTPERIMPSNIGYSPWKTFSAHSSKLKKSAVGEYLKFLNTADKDDLKKLKGIGEKRATYIVELREDSPEPFKTLDDLKDIGLSEKQIKGLLRKEVGEYFQ